MDQHAESEIGPYCNESLNYTLSILHCTQTTHVLVLLGTSFLPSDPFTRALGQWLEMNQSMHLLHSTTATLGPHGLAARHDVQRFHFTIVVRSIVIRQNRSWKRRWKIRQLQLQHELECKCG